VKAFVGDQSRIDAALFEVRTDDELVVAGSAGGRTSYVNAGKTLRRGVEISVDSTWANGFTGRLVYTGLHAIYDSSFTSNGITVADGKRLPGVAAHTLFAELAWRHAASGFHAAVEGVVRSRIHVEDTNTQPAAPGYGIANLRVGVDRAYGPWRMNAFARVDNLFDRQYVGSVIVGDRNGRYYESAPGRGWLVGVGLRHTF